MEEQSVRENLREWVRLVQSEYSEMPGLLLSRRQAQRLWNLDAPSAPRKYLLQSA